MKNRLSVVLLLVGIAAHAQVNKATVNGLVRDASGAIVPGVKVTATNVATNLSSETTSGASGDYTIPALNPGEYRLEAESPGFKKTVLASVLLQVSQQARVDLTLEVGQVSEKIDVTAAAPALETESPIIGGVINEARVQALPLNGRNFMELTTLTAGINEGTSSNSKNVLSKSFAPAAAGMPATENSYQLDGVDNKEPLFASFNVAPSVDAIGEFRIQVGQYSAEFGAGGGAVINVVTKSGTNQFHGTLLHFLRNDKLDARNFFATSKPPLRLNQFGGYAGGPIVKDRTFIFGGYEGSRERRGITFAQTLPTAEQRAGDLSGLGKTIRDPLNAGMPFPGNIIPSNRLDPISQRILTYYPAPNVPGARVSNFINSPSRVVDQDNYLVKVDHRLSGSNDLMGRFAHQEFERFTPGAFPLAGGLNSPQTYENTAIGLTTRVTPLLINELRFGYSHVISNSVGQNVDRPIMRELGLVFQGQTNLDVLNGFPEGIVLNNSSFSTFGEPLPRIYDMKVFQIYEGVTWSRNKHTLKFGADVKRDRVREPVINYVRRGYTFGGQYTGDGLGDFLLGFASAANAGLDISPPFDYSRLNMGFYAVDDWKLSSKLTLNMGLRYEYVTPAKEEGGFTPLFDRTLGGLRFPKQNTAAQSFYTNLRPDLPFGFLDRETLFRADTNNLAPRFGFAYRPFNNTRTVIRGGYGWFYSQSASLNFINNAFTAPPGAQLVSLTGNTITPDLSYSGKIGLAPQDLFKGLTFGILTGAQDIMLNGYTQQWSMSVGQEVGQGLVLEAQYLGSKGTHLETSNDFNSTNTPRAGALVNNIPFPQWGRLFGFSSGATANYNAMLLTAEKRFGEGLAFKGAYTWSKALGGHGGRMSGGHIGIPQNPQDLTPESGRTSDDVRHRLSVNYVYNLPFFRTGQGFAGKVLGGWKAMGVTTFRTGLPLIPTINSANCNSAFMQTCRPDLIGENFGLTGGSGVDSPRWARTAFDWPQNPLHPVQPPRFGNAAPNILTSNVINNWDLSIAKDTLLGESKRLELRFEMFNVWNHASFANPNPNVDSPLFGRTTATATDPRDIQIGLKLYW